MNGKRNVRRVVAALIVLVLVFTMSFSAFAKVGMTYASRVQGLRIHKGPNGNSEQIGKLERGQKVVHLASKNGWWKIKTASGQTGYVYRTYLKPVEPTWVRGGKYKVYKTTKAALRQGPRSESAKVADIKRGTVVVLHSRQGEWGKVKTAATGKVGWLQLKYLTPAS